MNKDNLTLVIADDHPIMLNGLYDELTTNGYNVIAKAANGIEALEFITEKQPTIALLDIDMPKLSGFEVIQLIKQKQLPTLAIVLSYHKEAEYITQAENLGIKGYLLKEDSFSVIEKCMEEILKGNRFFSPSFQDETLNEASKMNTKLHLLTPSEKSILKQIAKQKSTSEIAEKLFISKRTVEKHRSNIIQKLEINTQTNALLQWALINKHIINSL